MRVIFLDIDGVLNCEKTPNPRKFPYIVDPSLLGRLNRIVSLTGATVVLSSTWRYDPAGLFSAKYWGIPFSDVIPDMPECARRDEILSWLKSRPDVERYVVLDDEDDELDDLPLFQPSSERGLSDEIADGIVAYLRGATNKDMRRARLARFFQNIYSAVRGHQG
jgi:hypothetical protein